MSYINFYNQIPLPMLGKMNILVENGAIIIEEPIRFQENLVCVLHHPQHDAVAHIFNGHEMIRISKDPFVPKTWLIVKNLSDYR